MTKLKTNIITAISIGVLLFLGHVNSASAEGPVVTFRGEGDFANVAQHITTTTGFKNLAVSVSQGGDVDNPQTFLSYDREELSFGVLIRQFGFGMIPNSSVTNDNTGQQLTLDIDLSTLSPPSFLQFHSVTIGVCTHTTPPIPSTGTIPRTAT